MSIVLKRIGVSLVLSSLVIYLFFFGDDALDLLAHGGTTWAHLGVLRALTYPILVGVGLVALGLLTGGEVIWGTLCVLLLPPLYYVLSIPWLLCALVFLLILGLLGSLMGDTTKEPVKGFLVGFWIERED